MTSPFRRGVAAWLVGVVTASLVLGLALVVIQPGGDDVQSSGADAFSRSAVGHRAFVALLRAEGVPVLLSRFASAERAGKRSLLMVAEPHVEKPDSAPARRLRDMTTSARATFLVLPKWRVRASRSRGWIDSAELQTSEQAELPLSAIGVEGRVARPAASGRCVGAAVGAWPHPQLLLRQGTLVPVVQCDAGILLGLWTTSAGGRVYVLSDPDVVQNHGLARDGGAALALELLSLVRPEGQAVVVDETLHGFERVPSIWRELFAFPLLPATVQALLALGALVASGLVRFGAPVPLGRGLATGRQLLIDNTAALLDATGHSAHALGRYFDAALGDVARSTRFPANAPRERVFSWVAELGRRRGVRPGVSDLAARVEGVVAGRTASRREVLAVARAIHRWKGEILDGPGGRSADQGPRARRDPAGGRRA